MSASLVGSEMCIRDSFGGAAAASSLDALAAQLPDLHAFPGPIGLWAACASGAEWRPGSPTRCITGLTLGVAMLLQLILQ
eukprot:12376468-Alexandrium_andersonii.AAC.1